MTEFVLVRHGETDWNVQGRLQGKSDIPLNTLGLAQAKAASEGLRDTSWDVVIASPLQRAWQTAVIITRELGLDPASIIPNPGLRERAYGQAEGLTVAEREQRFPDNVWPDAEAPQAMNERAGNVMEEMAATYAGKRILVVSHGGWIRAAVRVTSGFNRAISDRSIPNTSRTYISHDGQHWLVGEVAVTW